MLRSMTGFGRGTCQNDGREITIELKSVNHKFLDLGFRMPRALSYLEDTIRTAISEKLVRGHVDICLTYKNNRNDTCEVLINEGLVQKYIAAGTQLEKDYSIRNDMSVMSLLRMPEVVSINEVEDDSDTIKAMALEATEAALREMLAMREREGEKLQKDFLVKIANIEQIREKLLVLAPQVVAENAKKLEMRIEKLMPEGTAIDEARLATEIAIIADKACVDEELVRIHTHVENLKQMLELHEPIGRKADFLVQELNREFNTTGSKSTESKIAELVIAGKAEIEKIREQIQNIE